MPFLLDRLFLDHCAICDDVGASPCHNCVTALPPAPHSETPKGLDSLDAAFAYETSGRQLIAALKFHNRRGALTWIAQQLALLVVPYRSQTITWVPSSYKGRTERGFDTGALLAKQLAHLARIPVVPLIQRTSMEMQSTRNEEERARGPGLRVRGREIDKMSLTNLILVDDVSTSGASLSTAAYALREFGVREIHGAVAARTPRRNPPGEE